MLSVDSLSTVDAKIYSFAFPHYIVQSIFLFLYFVADYFLLPVLVKYTLIVYSHIAKTAKTLSDSDLRLTAWMASDDTYSSILSGVAISWTSWDYLNEAISSFGFHNKHSFFAEEANA